MAVRTVHREPAQQAPTTASKEAVKTVAYYLAGSAKARVTRSTGLTTRDGDAWVVACFDEAVRCNRMPRVVREVLASEIEAIRA